MRKVHRANFDVEERTSWSITLRDVGPHDQFPTITNAAEGVIEDLMDRGDLWIGRRVFYIDSDGRKDELLWEGRRFVGFAPGDSR